RIAEASALVAGPPHVELRVGVHAGGEQQVDHLDRRYRRTAVDRRATPGAWAALTATPRTLTRSCASLTCCTGCCASSLRLSASCCRSGTSGTRRSAARCPGSAGTASAWTARTSRAGAGIANRDVERRPAVDIPQMRIAPALHQKPGNAVEAVV